MTRLIVTAFRVLVPLSLSFSLSLVPVGLGPENPTEDQDIPRLPTRLLLYRLHHVFLALSRSHDRDPQDVAAAPAAATAA